MTDQELIDYYAGLLIVQYADKPNAVAQVKAIAEMALVNQLAYLIQTAFNLEDSVGAQLDVIGKYAGASRTYGSIVLNDDDYRTIIKLAIIKNSAGSDLATIQDLVADFFPGQIVVFDYKGMRMSFFLDTSLGSLQLARIAIRYDLLPVPMAVGLSSTIYAPGVSSFFGFCTYELEPFNNSPFNTYEDYNMDSPWLMYEYAIS